MGGWEREVVLVQVWEEFHSRELKHLADRRQRDVVVVELDLMGPGVSKLKCLLLFDPDERERCVY